MNKDTLQGSEKTIVWIADIVNPVITGFFILLYVEKNIPC